MRKIFPLTIAVTALMIGANSPAVQAGPEEVRPFDIEAQPLDSALLKFSEQAELQLVVPASLLEGIDSPGFSGEGTAQQALVALLAETNLRFSSVGATVTITGDGDVGRDGQPGSGPKEDQAADTDSKGPGNQDAGNGEGDVGEAEADSIDAGDGAASRTNSGEVWEEIIVTASRRSETVLDTSSSLSVFSEALMRDSGSRFINDLLGFTPSIVADTPDLYGASNRFTIRGVSAQPLTSATVGVYLDDVPLTLGTGNVDPTIRMFDLKRVEVLRGPQGTLYGAGAMGGAIRYVSNKPDASAFAGGLRLELLNTRDGDNSFAADGMVNFPLIDDWLALRLTGSRENKGGFIDLTNAIGGPYEDANTRELSSVRGVVRFTPTDKLTIDLQVWREEDDYEGLRVLNAAASSELVDDAENGILAFGDNAFDQLAGSLAWQLGWVDVVSTTSLVETEGMFSFPQPLGLPFNLTTMIPSRHEGFSHETRLVSRAEGRFNWIVGVFYHDWESEGGLTIPDFGLSAELTDDRKQTSVYGEAGYRFARVLEATIGLRHYSEDSVQKSTRAFGPFVSTLEKEGKFTKTVSKFLLSYQPADTLNVYASASQGFRVGGVNLSPVPADPVTFDPDSLWAYELGAKFVLSGGVISGNLTAFYNDWSDIQIFQFGLGGGIIVNGGEAHSAGAEAQLNLRLTENLSLALSASVMEAQFDETVEAAQIQEGRRIPDVARENASLILDYSLPLPNGNEYFLHIAAIFKGDQVNPDQSRKQGSGMTYNARTGLLHGNWEAAVHLRNIGNRLAKYEFNNFYFGVERPRTIGIEVSYRF